MEQLAAYAQALEVEKNEKFALAGRVEEIISNTEHFETEIPPNVSQKMRNIESVTENMITEVKPINTSRLEFASLFTKTTGSQTSLTPNGLIIRT